MTASRITAARTAIARAETRIERWATDYSPRGRRCYDAALAARAAAVARLDRAEQG